MRVRALKAHTFGGKERVPHEEYSMSGHYLKLVRALGWAEEVKPPPPLDAYETREVEVEMPKAKRKYVRKKPYKRRDMRAED